MNRKQLFDQIDPHVLRQNAFRLPQLPDISEDIDPYHKKMILSVCSRTEILPLVRSIEFKVIADMDLPFRVPSADEIYLHPGILRHNSLTALFLRYALEIAVWESKMSGYVPVSFFLSIAVLAAITAKVYWESMIQREQQLILKYMPREFQHIFELTKDIDSGSFLEPGSREEMLPAIKELLRLQDVDNIHDSMLTEDVFNEANRFVRQGSIMAAPSEYLLTQGGDSRLKTDRVSGLSGYGCSTKPRPWAVTFASSTATSISSYAFGRVERVRQKFIEGVCLEDINERYDAQVESIKSRILEAFGLKDIEGAEVILTTSGTDAELFASFLAYCENMAPFTNIFVGPEETGTGSPLAASGRHFSVNAPLGNNVCKGEMVEGFPDDCIRLLTVPLRDYNGTFLGLDSVDSRVEMLTSKAIAAGNRVLVHIVESSKTGLTAPSLNTVKRLKTIYGPSLDVLVDACQLRIGRKRLRQYLEAGFMIAVTGSKFYTGPAFSGALILPPDVACRLNNEALLPSGFTDYFSSYAFPQRMNMTKLPVEQSRIIGLLLRWEAALWEIEAFQRTSDKHKYLIFSLFGESIRESISANPDLELISSPALERWKLPDDEEWDWLPTIFTFIMSRPAPRGIRIPFSLEEAKKIYQWLNMDISGCLPEQTSEAEILLSKKRCHIGQPVKIALMGDHWAGALRISAGARLVSGICFDTQLGRHFAERLSREIGDACSALDKISLIIKYFDYIEDSSSHMNSCDNYNEQEFAYLI